MQLQTLESHEVFTIRARKTILILILIAVAVIVLDRSYNSRGFHLSLGFSAEILFQDC